MTEGANRWTYRHSGLVVGSNFPIPEWDAFADIDAGAPDVCLSCLPVLSEKGEEAGEIAFRIPGVGAYRVSEGRRIAVAPDPRAEPSQWRLFVLGSAWGALGYQRGFAMWHGAVAARDGRALLLCGASGEGKSTLAGALVARGAQLVSDDLARVDPGPGQAVVHPASARIKLWGEVVARLGWQDRIIQRDWLREDKFHCTVPRHAAGAAPHALAGIVILATGEGPALTRLTGSEALGEVMRATLYRPGTLDALGAWPEQGALAAQILANTPAWRLTRPRDLGRIDECAALAESLWGR